MKKIVLVLVAMLMFTQASAQEIYVKKTEKKAYYRVKLPNRTTLYAELHLWEEPTMKNMKDPDAVISAKKYIKIQEEEQLLSRGWVEATAMDKDVVNDEKYIEAQPISDKPIASFVNFEQGRNYELLRVTSAKDASLIGCNIVCQVLERRKSTILGAEGRLSLLPLFIESPKGKIPLMPTPIQRRGLNRTNAKFWSAILIVPLFIPGTRAELSPGEKLNLRLE